MAQKSPQFDVDKARSQMRAEDLAGFDHFCRFSPTYGDIQRRLQELGFQVSGSAVQAWFTATHPVGHEAKVINALTLNYAGVEPFTALQMSMAIAVNLTDALMKHCTPERLASASAGDLMMTIGNLLKEMRTCARVLQDVKVTRDRKALELSGGYRVVEILRHLSEDSSQAESITDFCDAALLQLEQEVNG
ncbi:hypothetical protein [Stenomitos frigidus]|uniref:Uncharacterized protein n=1 Tax=Stenomitos frigidus ULC18 TaxID=2107698 RepID=A0A2T1EB40_9CYAN|nr:hypothetical protein [Stenomitos frigidus]PSB29905.1 hypothetical protein C7B82_10150 [Stenomitos frigidus ULC18]